jgi:hypothetical protein
VEASMQTYDNLVELARTSESMLAAPSILTVSEPAQQVVTQRRP